MYKSIHTGEQIDAALAFFLATQAAADGTGLGWLSGSGVPDNGIGSNGRYYLDTATADVYKKADGVWGSPILNLKGLTGNPYKAYPTLAAANADLANIPAEVLVWINADSTAANIGYWSKTGGVLVQSPYDRVALVEADVAASINRIAAAEGTISSVDARVQRLESAFHPSELFTNGESGFVFDPSADGTLFQTVECADAAVAHGDPVGVILDMKTGTPVAGFNLSNFTEDVANSFWAKARITPTIAAAILPPVDGMAVNELLETVDNGVHNFTRSYTYIDGVFSVGMWVKPAGRSKVRLAIDTNNFIADFDLVNGTVVNQYSCSAATITGGPDGWQFIEASASVAAGAHSYGLYLLNASDAVTYIGDVTKGVYVTAIQLGLGALGQYQKRGGTATVNHVGTLTTSRRGTLHVSGSQKAVAFDGISQMLSTVLPVNLGNPPIITAILAITQDDGTVVGVVWECGTGPAVGSGGLGGYINNGEANVFGVGAGLGGANYLYLNDPVHLSNPKTFVAVTVFDPGQSGADKLITRVNGDVKRLATVGSAGAYTANPTATPQELFVGGRSGGSLFAKMKLWAAVVINRVLSTDEILQAESWAAAKAGCNIYGDSPDQFTDSGALVDKTTYWQTSPLARACYDTEATAVEVTSYNNIFGTYPQYTELGVVIDGEFYASLAPGAAGYKTAALSLPAGRKRVEFVNGLQSKPSSSVIGTFLVDVAFNQPFLRALPASKNRVVVYGDSIAVGSDAQPPTEYGWVVGLRNARRGSKGQVALEGWGYRSLYDDCYDAPARAVFVSKLESYAPTVIWLAIGTNDYGLNKWNAAAFGTAYAALLDDFHTALPGAAIYAQTPLVRSGEGVNSVGSTLPDYRTAIQNACTGRSWVTYVDGTAILTTADLADGLHPKTVGHLKYAKFVANAILE